MFRFLTLITTLFFCLATSSPCNGQVGGVSIDPKGILQLTPAVPSKTDFSPAPPEVAHRNDSRHLSLKRLEATILEHQRLQRPLPVEIRYLAGLQRIEEVVLLPSENDAILIGPAAGWTRSPGGGLVDPQTQRPLLELDDLAVALRFSIASNQPSSFIGCSIDPTDAGLKRYARYLRKLKGPLDSQRFPSLEKGMQRAMGLQDVRIFGVPDNSRFASKLVIADYFLKRLAMGFDRPPIKGWVSYMDLLSKSGKNAVRRQHRFWFVATHNTLTRSADHRIWHFNGPGLAVRTAATTSKDSDKSKASPVAARMAEHLTDHFPLLAKHIPVFGELENLARLAVAAEIVVNAPIAESQTRWHSRVLVDPQLYLPKTTRVPRHVSSLAVIRKARGRNWIMSISGGVKLQPPPVASGNAATINPRLRIHRRPKDSTKWWWDG